LDSEKDDENNVKFFVINLALDRFNINDRERRKMVYHLLLCPTESTSPYMLVLAAPLTCVIPDISYTFKRLFKQYSTGLLLSRVST